MRHSTNHQTIARGLLDKCAMAIVATLLVATTAGTIAASSRARPVTQSPGALTVTPELWKQTTPAFILNLPGGFGVEEALY